MTRDRTSSRRPTRRSERGAAAVEMAFMLPVLLFVLFGIIDFGRMLNAQITLTEAAREGARAASFSQPDQDVKDRVTSFASPGLTGVTTVVTACPATPTPTADAVVTSTYTFTYITPVASMAVLFGGTISGTKTMTGKGVMPCLH